MNQDSSTTSVTQRLADSGLRSTRQREVVYEMILAKRDHPTAEEIFERVKVPQPSISLATVYNCLEALVQCGLIKQVSFGREPTRYCPNLHAHAHFHDDSTGEIHDIDLPDDVMNRLRALLPPGSLVANIDLSFRGSLPKPADDTASKATR